MHTRYIQVGGVIEDMPDGWVEKVREFTAIMPERVDAVRALLNKNEIFLNAHEGRLPARRGDAARLGVTGPLLRAAGNPWDLRKAMPYSSYDDFDFKIPVGTVGDNYDRYAVRWPEMRESVKIIDQALDGLPEGPFITEDRKVALPPRHELATSMEALIHHFKLVTEGFRVPPGEVYYPIEGPRGEYGCFVRSDGSSKPARVHMRDPSFVNLQATAPMVRDAYIADTHRHAGACSTRSSGASTANSYGDRSDERPRFGTARASRAGTRRPTSTKEPADVPDPATTPVPEDLRARIEDSCPLPRPPLGRDPGAARGPGALRLVHAGGHRAGRLRHAPHARLPHRGRDLLRHARDAPVGAPRSTSARTSRARCAAPTRCCDGFARRPATTRLQHPRLRVPGRVRHRADGLVDGEYVGPVDARRGARARAADPRRRRTAARQAAAQARVRRPQGAASMTDLMLFDASTSPACTPSTSTSAAAATSRCAAR
jgi:hypothetical protein